MIRDYQAIQYTWFLRGKQRMIPTYGKHHGVKLIGVLNYETGKVHVVEEERYNAEAFLRFLQYVLQQYPIGKIVLVLDNARIHHAKLVQPFLEEHKNIKNKIRELRNSPIQNNETELEIIKLKREFRRLQRLSIFQNEQKKLNELDKIAKLRNKKIFWNFFNNQKRKRLIQKEVSCSNQILFEHFKKVFHESYDKLTSEQINICEDVKKYILN
mgnify:CR=1 FL=1